MDEGPGLEAAVRRHLARVEEQLAAVTARRDRLVRILGALGDDAGSSTNQLIETIEVMTSVPGMSQTVFPCITFRDAHASIDWLERVLGAERLAVFEDGDGRVNHAEVQIGESVVMAGDERAGSRATPPGASAGAAR